MPDLYSDQLSAYLDGELPGSRRRRLEAHLAECAECSRTLADLRAIAAAAPHYQGREPSRELWPEIAARLNEAEVVPLRAERPSARPTVRRSARFSWPQLIAASLLMGLVGGGATWLAVRDRSPERSELAGTGSPVLQPALTPKDVEYAESQYDAAVRDLEQVLAAGRSQLDTATVRVIELSLRRIDLAIAEARAAVQRDPANAYLSRQIAANMLRKLNLLRIATNAIART